MQWQRQRGLYLGIAGNGANHRRQHVRIARHPDHNRAPRPQVVELDPWRTRRIAVDQRVAAPARARITYKARGTGSGVTSMPLYPLARSLGASSSAMCQEKMMAHSG